MVFLNWLVDSPEKSVMQQGQKARMESNCELMAMQTMNMCKRRTFTEDEIWSVVETLKIRYNS